MARRNHEIKFQLGKNILGKKPSDKFENVKLWKEVRAQSQRQGVYSLRFSYEGDMLAVGYGNGAVDYIDVHTGRLEKNLRQARYGGFQVMCMQFSPIDPNVLFMSTSEGDVITSNVGQPESREPDCQNIISEENNEINCFDFSNDGFVFATSGKDLGVRLYDTKTQRVISKWGGSGDVASSYGENKRNSMRVFALKFHPIREDMFITGGWDNQLKIWDARARNGVQRSISGPHICGDSLDVRENEILSGSWVGTKSLQLWEYSDGLLIKDIKFPHNDEGDFLYCAQFGEGDVVLAGGSGTNSVEVVRHESKKVIGGIKMGKPVQAMDSTFGGRLFALAGQDNVIKIATIT